jgi:hypothetical protein
VDRAQQIGLLRWQIVGEATDMSLSARERGRLAARWPSASTWRRTGAGSGSLERRWIGGSARIVKAALTRWSGWERHA